MESVSWYFVICKLWLYYLKKIHIWRSLFNKYMEERKLLLFVSHMILLYKMMPLHDSYKQGASSVHLRCELNNRNVMYIEISAKHLQWNKKKDF